MKRKGTTRQQHHGTAIERLQMVEQFRRSGLTRAAFSRQYGIPLATLGWWLAKAKRDSNLPAPVVFSEVMIPPLTSKPTFPWAMEIVCPSGIMIRYREALSGRDLARLLRGNQC